MKKINKSLVLLLIVTIFSPSLVVFADDSITSETVQEISTQNTTEAETTSTSEISIQSETVIPANETQISATPVIPNNASAFTFETDKESYILGETVTVKVKLNTSSASVNSIISQIGFSSDKLEIESVTAGDVVTLWTQSPVYSTNTIDLSGVITDGYNGTNGRVLTITFKSISSGNAEIKFNTLFVQGSDLQNLNMTDWFNSHYFLINDIPSTRITGFFNDTGINDTDHITSNNTPTFTGTAHPNTDVTLSIVNTCTDLKVGMGCAGIILGSTTSDADGNWSIGSNSIPDGIWQVVASENYNDTLIDSSIFLITIDTQKPVVEYVYFHNGATVNVDFTDMTSLAVNNNTDLVIVAGINDITNIEKTEILLWNMGETGGDGSESNLRKIGYSKIFSGFEPISYDLSTLSLKDGTYRVVILSKDLAGNEVFFGEKTFTFIIDSIVPVAPVITSPVSGETSETKQIVVSGTCSEDFGKVSLTGEIQLGKGDPDWKPEIGNVYGWDTDCIEGVFTTKIDNIGEDLILPATFAAVVTDRAGNMSPISNIVTLTKPSPRGGGGGGGGGGSSSNTNTNICPLKILGDINCDGKVNKYDFALMMMAWGLKVSDKADLNTDIKVDKYDFALLMSNWGYGEVKR